MTLEEARASTKVMLSSGQVAQIIGVSEYSIRQQAAVNAAALGFPVCIMGSRIRVPREAFLRWLDGQGGEPSAPGGALGSWDERLRRYDKPFLNLDQVAEVLEVDFWELEKQARLAPEKLGFATSVIGERVVVPRVALQCFLKYGRPLVQRMNPRE